MKTGGSEEAMKGIVLLSHGNLAEGLLQASAIFFGEQPQIQALGYQMTEDCDEFAEKIGYAIAAVDSGEGVIILCDLFAGTPAHKTTGYLNPGKVDVLCGVNLPLLLEILGQRQTGQLDLEELMMTGREGIRPWQPTADLQEEEFY